MHRRSLINLLTVIIQKMFHSTQSDRFFHGHSKRNTKYVKTDTFKLSMSPARKERKASHSKTKTSRMFESATSNKTPLNATLKFNFPQQVNSRTVAQFIPPALPKKNRLSQTTDRMFAKEGQKDENTDQVEKMEMMSAVRLRSHLRSKIQSNALQRYTNFYHRKNENRKSEVVSQHNIKQLIHFLATGNKDKQKGLNSQSNTHRQGINEQGSMKSFTAQENFEKTVSQIKQKMESHKNHKTEQAISAEVGLSREKEDKGKNIPNSRQTQKKIEQKGNQEELQDEERKEDKHQKKNEQTSKNLETKKQPKAEKAQNPALQSQKTQQKKDHMAQNKQKQSSDPQKIGKKSQNTQLPEPELKNKKSNTFWGNVDQNDFDHFMNQKKKEQKTVGKQQKKEGKKEEKKDKIKAAYKQKEAQMEDEIQNIQLGGSGKPAIKIPTQSSQPSVQDKKAKPEPQPKKQTKKQQRMHTEKDAQQFMNEVGYYLNLIDTVGEYHIMSKKFYEKRGIPALNIPYKATSYFMWQQLYYLRQLTINAFSSCQSDWLGIQKQQIQQWVGDELLLEQIEELKEENQKCKQFIKRAYKEAKQQMDGRERVFSIDKKVNYCSKCLKNLQDQFKDIQKQYKKAVKGSSPLQSKYMERMCYLIEVFCVLKFLNNEQIKQQFEQLEDIRNFNKHYQQYRHLIVH